jgi:hypothetical protein
VKKVFFPQEKSLRFEEKCFRFEEKNLCRREKGTVVFLPSLAERGRG